MQPGDVLGGRWRLDRRADAGGMGVVHRGTDLSTGAPVAIKVLVTDGERERARFGREARALAELAHPAIVRYLDHGVVGGQPYLVMEWVDGESLADRIARTGVTIVEAIALVRRAAEGLAVAHRRGLVHRDVKPGNLLLPDGDPARLKVIDFGIALRSDASVRLTRSGGVVGTPAYVAPELARGGGDADARADVFSLGCVLFECLAGRPAFAGGGAWAVLARILLEEPPRLTELVPHLPPELEALVARLLAKDPAARPADADAVIVELDALPPPPAGAPAMVAPLEYALTADEQRLVAVVLIAAPAAGPWSTMTLAEGTATTATVAPPLPLAVLAEVVAAYGARFERLLGGPAAIVLEGGGAATDRAAAAARCALALRRVSPDALVALAVGRAQARAGVHHSLIGEAIDRALALIDPAEQGVAGVRLDPVAAGLLDAGFVVADDGDGGRRLIAERAGLTPRPLLGRSTPFVGRDRELAMLQAVVVGGEQASCVLISGPPGSGKSRLVGELLARQGWVDPWIARGDALAAGSPLGLLGQIVRASAGISEHDPPAARRASLLEVARARLGRGDALRVFGFLAEVAGAPVPAEEAVEVLLVAARQDVRLMADQIRRTWEDWVVAACRRAPVVIVLEDLHWSDRATVALVDAALAACADLPLVVIASARPEVHELFGDPWAARGVQEIRLAPLPPRACERLVRAVLGDQLAPEVLDRVVAQADGNALFLEELIRAVAAGASELPATVVAMVGARLQAMEPEVRRVLRAASVFGQRFRAAGVAALLGGGEVERDDAERWLELLVEREVVARAGDGEHAFRHALVRDAAYEMLTDDDRGLGHRLAAAWLERVGDAEPRVLAEHHERAGDPRRAARWWRRAAEVALEGDDYAAAVQAAERGVDAGAEGEVAGALRAVQVEAHRWMGDFTAAEAAAALALRALPSGSAPWCAVAQEALRASHRTGRRDRLLELASEITEVANPASITAFQLRTAYIAAEHLLRVGERAAAAPLLALGEAADPRLRDQPMVAGAAAEAMAIDARFAGDPAGVVRASEAGARAYRSVGDRRRALLMALSLGDGLIHGGDPARALAVLTATCDEAARGVPGLLGLGYLNLGLARHHLGDLDGADLDISSSIGRAIAAGNRDLEGFARMYRAKLLLDRGGDAAVVEAAAEVEVAIDRFAHAAPARGHALGVRSRARLVAGDLAGARADADAAMAILADAGLQEGEAEVRLAHLDALVAAGELEVAAVALAAAQLRLDQRAARLSDDAAAQRFRAVPVNAALAARGELLSRPR